jgi:PIN domain nuclease of toxin-antitoxin system
LTARSRAAIADVTNEVVVAIGALWELAIKRSFQKLHFPFDFETVLREENFQVLPISFAHLHAFDALPRLHRDPFDRMMIAQALAEGIPIATGDRVFAAYGVQVIW